MGWWQGFIIIGRCDSDYAADSDDKHNIYWCRALLEGSCMIFLSTTQCFVTLYWLKQGCIRHKACFVSIEYSTNGFGIEATDCTQDGQYGRL